MYVELIEKEINRRGKIIAFDQVPTNPVDFCRYVSLFPFDAGIKDYVKTRGTVGGYKGKHYCPSIIIDIDCEDLESSRKSTTELVARLNEVYNCSPDNIRIFFSGNKGFHIGLHEKLFGSLPANENIAEFVKRFVIELTDGIKNIDTKIYEPHRIFRCVNSVNEKSGLYKVQLSFEELSLSVDEIKEIARQPRLNFRTGKLIGDLQKNELLYKKLASIKIDQKSEKEISVGFFTPPKEGERNNKLFLQACTLFDKSEISTTGISEIIKSINQAGDKPLSDFEVSNLIQSAKQKTSRVDKQAELIIKPFGGWVDEWYESILPEKNKMSLVFPYFNAELKGKIRGKLICVVGAGGTKKSLFAQNMIYDNIAHGGCRAIYSTMEMGVSVLMDRFIDMVMDSENNYNASYDLELINNKNPGVAREAVRNEISSWYSDKLMITQNTGMVCSQYSELIERVSAEYGTVDLLIVDGLSMMGGKGTETELVNQHTRELKELAVKYNIAVVPIVHVTKEAERTTRDVTKFLRGSGKIYDNLDVSINMSLFQDNFTDGFKEDRGFAKLINKRGSGNHVDVVYEFNPRRLWMTQTEERRDQHE